MTRGLLLTTRAGCRRLTPGDGYLEALVQPNVTRVFDEIDHITPTGLVTDDGKLHEVDVLICATGFNIGFTPSFTLKGVNGHIIQEEWAKGPNCYLGLGAPHYPNYFTILGPRGPWGNGPILPSVCVLPSFICMGNNDTNEHSSRSRHCAITSSRSCRKCKRSKSRLSKWEKE